MELFHYPYRFVQRIEDAYSQNSFLKYTNNLCNSVPSVVIA